MYSRVHPSKSYIQMQRLLTYTRLYYDSINTQCVLIHEQSKDLMYNIIDLFICTIYHVQLVMQK